MSRAPAKVEALYRLRVYEDTVVQQQVRYSSSSTKTYKSEREFLRAKEEAERRIRYAQTRPAPVSYTKVPTHYEAWKAEVGSWQAI